MNKRVIFGFICIVLVMGQSLCYGDAPGPDYAKVSELFFPETAGWMPVTRLKTPGEAFLKRHAEDLKRTYYTSEVSKNWERGYCSFIDRLLSEEQHTLHGFFVHDLDGDEIPDIIYTGENPCGEGYATIIWFGSPAGFVVRQSDFWPMLLLHVKEKSPPRLSSVSVGCCSDLVDEYYIGHPGNFRNDGMRRITKNTLLPEGLQNRKRFVAGMELVLRSSPHIDNVYDEAASHLQDEAVFGNILSRFLPGCSGAVIGRQVDDKSGTWLFVILDQSVCNALRTHSPYRVNAGWVEDAVINPK